jgi:hypothetical protein
VYGFFFWCNLEESRSCKPIIVLSPIFVPDPLLIFVLDQPSNYVLVQPIIAPVIATSVNYPCNQGFFLFLRGIGSLPLMMLVKITIRTIIGPKTNSMHGMFS